MRHQGQAGCLQAARVWGVKWRRRSHPPRRSHLLLGGCPHGRWPRRCAASAAWEAAALQGRGRRVPQSGGDAGSHLQEAGACSVDGMGGCKHEGERNVLADRPGARHWPACPACDAPAAAGVAHCALWQLSSLHRKPIVPSVISRLVQAAQSLQGRLANCALLAAAALLHQGAPPQTRCGCLRPCAAPQQPSRRRRSPCGEPSRRPSCGRAAACVPPPLQSCPPTAASLPGRRAVGAGGINSGCRLSRPAFNASACGDRPPCVPRRPSFRPCASHPLQSFLRMKADSAWQTLEAKVAGTDGEYRDCTVTPLIATTPAATCPPGADPACMLPAEASRAAGGLCGAAAAAAGGAGCRWCVA